MSDPEETIDRRRFLTKSAALLGGGAAFVRTALSYDKILGANDRISVCHIGNGSRGGDLDWIVSQLKTRQNVETTAICDLWRLNREKAVAVNAKYYGRAPRGYQYLEDVLALKDVDAVIISTPEHSHSPVEESARLLHAIFPNYPGLNPCRQTPPIEEWPLLISSSKQQAPS